MLKQIEIQTNVKTITASVFVHSLKIIIRSFWPKHNEISSGPECTVFALKYRGVDAVDADAVSLFRIWLKQMSFLLLALNFGFENCVAIFLNWRNR